MRTIIISITFVISSLYATSQTREIHVLIADTSGQYFDLYDNMYALSELTGLEIDTMDRSWNEEKQLLCLANDHEDEIYAGEYYPRRFEHEHLSIEYLWLYTDATDETLALVAGIYETAEQAQQAHEVIIEYMPNAHIITTEMYMGCIH